MSTPKINLYALLDELEKRKAMYLGNEYTFHSLNTFIIGFTMGCDRSQLETEQYNNFNAFNIWLLGHLPEHFGEGGGWYWQISNRTRHKDEAAFKEFFHFLDIFKTAKRKKEKIPVEKFEFKSTEYNTRTKIETPKRKIVDSLYKITMEHSKAIWLQAFSQNELTFEQWFISEEAYENALKQFEK